MHPNILADGFGLGLSRGFMQLGRDHATTHLVPLNPNESHDPCGEQRDSSLEGHLRERMVLRGDEYAGYLSIETYWLSADDSTSAYSPLVADERVSDAA